MSTVAVPGSAGEALGMLESAMRFLAGADAAQMPGEALAEYLRALELVDAAGAVARGRMLAAFDAKDGHLADGQRSSRAWLVHCLRVTRAQAAEHLAVAGLAREHPALLAGLRDGDALTKSVALQLARWTRAIPARFREQAEEILAGAARRGAGRGRSAGAGGDLRGDPVPDRPAGRRG